MKLELIDYTTCKLIFADSVRTLEQANLAIKKHTSDFKIANFYLDREVGANLVTFAIVDIPSKAVQVLFNDKLIKDIDLMSSSQSKRPSGAEECSGGGCTPTG